MDAVASDVYSFGTRGHNFYLLRRGDEVTIIDAGCSREWSKLARGLGSIGLSQEAVAGILVTHAHADHFGFAGKAVAAGLAVSVHEAEVERAAGTYAGRFAAKPREIPVFNRYSLLTFLPMVVAGIMKLEHTGAVSTFQDGEVLDLPGHPVAIHTPGHTEGHTMFHLPRHGLLFTGDGLITMDMLGPGKGPQMIEQRFSLDHNQAMASLDRITNLDADLLLPGHGRPWAGTPAAAVELIRS